MRPDRITGLVLNWSPVEMAGLHIDPLSVRLQYVIDATRHATEVVKVVQKKVPGMAANPTYGGPRMGPIFGGMLLSGEKVAKELIARLS